MSEAVAEKVRKLLAKAEATSNANEAEAFSAKAAELMTAHRLDAAALRESLRRGALGVERVPLGRGAYVRARLALLGAVAGHHDVTVVFETGQVGTTALLAGFDDDLRTTRMFYESLHTQAAGQMSAIRKATPAATQRFRRAFLFGYAARVGELLAASAAVAAAPTSGAAPSTAGGLLPEVLERRQRVEAYAATAFGRVVAAKPAAPASASGFHHGHAAAGRADLGRRRLHGRPQLGRGGSGPAGRSGGGGGA